MTTAKEVMQGVPMVEVDGKQYVVFTKAAFETLAEFIEAQSILIQSLEETLENISY
jgi:hypothetical protein